MQNSFNVDLEKEYEIAKSVILQPVEFYRRLKRTGGFIEPVTFVLVMAVVGGLLTAIFSLFGAGRFSSFGIGAIILIPIMVVLWSFFGAVIMYAIWKWMGSSETYECAYRCVAYSAAIFPVVMIVLIPYMANIVGVVWGTYLMITASTEVHGLDKKKATKILGVLGFISLIINLGSERVNRQMLYRMDRLGVQVEQSMDNIGGMAPQVASETLARFMKDAGA